MLSCKMEEKLINTLDFNYDEIKAWSKAGILSCPACGSEVFFKNGDKNVPHFAHKFGELCECYTYYSKTFRQEAIGKSQLYKWAKDQARVQRCEIDFYFDEIGIRPSLYIETKNKKRAIEFVCSKIDREYKQNREEAYESIGVEFIWIFGGNHLVNVKNRYYESVYEPHDYQVEEHGIIYLYDIHTGKLQKLILEEGNTFRRKTAHIGDLKVTHLNYKNEIKGVM